MKDIQVDFGQDFAKNLFAKVRFYREISNHYDNEIQFVESLLSTSKASLSQFSLSLHTELFKYLEISTEVLLQSVDVPSVNRHSGFGTGQWALEISKAINATQYINPIGGKDRFSRQEFEEADIDLRFFEPEIEFYPQRRPEFVPGLSIIDPLLLHGKDFVISQVRKGKLS